MTRKVLCIHFLHLVIGTKEKGLHYYYPCKKKGIKNKETSQKSNKIKKKALNTKSKPTHMRNTVRLDLP